MTVRHVDPTGPLPSAALDALLRAAPGAMVAALGREGMVPFPPSLPLHGQSIFSGGSGMDLVIPEDQPHVLEAWERSDTEPIVRLEVRLLADPGEVATMHFFDLRPEHGVHVAVLEAADPGLASRSAEVRAALRPPVGHVVRDGMAVFVEADEATTSILGWSRDELVGRRTLELVHPDDVDRAVDAWIAMRSGAGTGRIRVRLRHADGHYVWLEVTNDNHLGDPEACVRSELIDVTEEVAHLEELRDRERNLARLSEALPIGVCHLRMEGDIAYSNEPLVSLLGRLSRREDLVRSVAGADRERVASAITQALGGLSADLEVSVLHGLEERRCELTFRPLFTDEGDLDGVIVCAADVTDRSRLRVELEHRASHDALTGCLNRAAAVSALEAALRSYSQVAVAYIDLDRFKSINDELGHAAGDELLRVAAARLRTAVRANDRIGRMGGDEFIVISPQGQGPFELAGLAARLQEAIDTDVTFARQRIPLRASIGVATSRPGELDAEAVLVRADAAMYDVKRRTRADGLVSQRLDQVPGAGRAPARR
jgi:diguanylate cyclase (GGDEF)-like protein/PAS domain S-box-containing protein